MLEENEDLGFCFPEEGFNVFIDAACIPKGCTNKEGAEAFINFLCRPDICGQNLEYLGYSSPNTASKEYMDPEVAESEISYPDEETLSRSESFSALPTETSQLMDSLWLSVKTSGNETTRYLIAGAVLVAVAVFVSTFLKLRRRKKLAMRGISRRMEEQ